MADSLYQQMIELDEFISAIPEDCDQNEYIEEFNAIMDRLESKVDGCAEYMDFVAGRIEELNLKKDRITDAIKSYETKRKQMQQYLIHCIEIGDKIKIEGRHTRISIRNNPPSLKTDFHQKQTSMKEVDPLLLPLEMKPYIEEKIIYYVNTQKLKRDLKENKTFESAHLERSKSIIIKEI